MHHILIFTCDMRIGEWESWVVGREGGRHTRQGGSSYIEQERSIIIHFKHIQHSI